MSGGKLTFLLEIEYADGRTEQVNADQRDMAAFEMDDAAAGRQSFAVAMNTRTFAAFRWIAWHALWREKRTRLSFAKWSEEAVNVEAIDAEDGEDTDPGPPAASEETSSESP